ncbi:MAG: hypothetical protein A3G87_04780 [Omnitrophica bacterium RIFCSPLOWO2_12_FULL_50_11]|nr:MAG: hypothetical protein A3G87_04780 [Omnitrophica bacterium RIFCSPLOWO2_12_FULL_50_11]
MGEQTIPDELLVERAREGNQAAFDALVLRYQGQAVAIAQSVVGEFHLAKDAAQNAFAKAYFGLKGFRSEAKFKTWLIRIVLNEARSVRRKERVRRFFFVSKARREGSGTIESVLEFVPSSEPLAQEVLSSEELKESIGRAIGTLPPRERDVLILHYFECLTFSEVAETLNVALGTVKAHLAHGLGKMKSIVTKAGVPHG